MNFMIKFGTGGWRAIIADGFTKENAQILTQALCNIMKSDEVCVGYDRRFLSDVAATWVSEVFAGNNKKVYFIDHAAPTPMIMYSVKERELEYGMAITASHNPAIYNGIKLFTYGGKDATETLTDALQIEIDAITEVKTSDFNQALNDHRIEIINPRNQYVDAVLSFLDLEAIKAADLKVIVDTMHGVSSTSLSMILNTARIETEIINNRHDTLFGGKLPTPQSSTLHKLSDMVIAGKYDLGIATDGDADRLGIIDESGAFIHPNILLSLIYHYLLKYKGYRGAVVRNLSTTHLVDRIAKAFGQQAIETPVGFKHITEGMEKYNAIIGGESSGGLTIKGHISGKDGIFAAALLVEIIAVTKKNISQLVQELEDTYGKLYVLEKDYSFDPLIKENLIAQLFDTDNFPDFGKNISDIRTYDGLKIVFEDDSWISARFSGTEPLLRIFSESSDGAYADHMIAIMEHYLSL